MIYYFSGTGNSRWAARKLAALTGDEARDIIGLDAVPTCQGEARIGLVFPIYAWGAPEPVLDFARQLDKAGAFTFAVGTCGSEAGHALKKLAAVFPLDSCYSLVMPNNYVIGSELEDEATVRAKLDAAETELAAIAAELRENKPVNRVHEGALAGLKSGLANFGFNRFARSTKSFYATDACNGCGLCAQNCPAHTITLTNGKPVWTAQCYQCLRCLNECPQTAIQYGKATETRGRYSLRRYRAD